MYIVRTLSRNNGISGEEEVLGLSDISERFLRILFEDILPIWSTLGIDHARGGFCESIGTDGAIPEVTRRVRVSARQIYAFSQAAQLGYNPTVATACIWHGYRFLEDHSSDHGLIHHSILPDGTCLDAGYDLYDQAFLLFACASAYRHLDDAAFRTRALRLLTSIRRQFSHVAGGFNNHTKKPFPLRSNPHMHLLEAALAWMAIDEDSAWEELADEIVELFQSRFLDPVAGAVRELFTPDWVAVDEEGRYRVEPGHNYEWAWLLLRWHALTGGDIGIAPRSMINFAETNGYDPVRHVAVNECWSDGLTCDRNARLWPQTERLKAWLALARESRGVMKQQAEARALDAARSLLSYLDRDTARGLWRDVMLEDGTFQAGAAPASSLYHIICAFGVLNDYVRESDRLLPDMEGTPAPALLANRPMELPV